MLMKKAGIQSTPPSTGHSEENTTTADDIHDLCTCADSTEEERLLCQNAGTTPAEPSVPADTVGQPYPRHGHGQEFEANAAISNTEQHFQPQRAQATTKKLRKSMKIWMILCLFYAGLYVVVGVSVEEVPMTFGMGGFFVILAAMFFVLAKSPKGNPFILGKMAGLKKPLFVLICIVVAFVVLFACTIYTENGTGTAGNSTASGANEKYSVQISVDPQENAATPDQTEKATDSFSFETAKQWIDTRHSSTLLL